MKKMPWVVSEPHRSFLNMIQSLSDFIAQYQGKINIGDTPENTGQCVGLIELWIDNLGLPHIWGNAIDLLKNADTKSFDIVMNTPTNSPSAGDIVVFGKPYGASIQNGITVYFGHCAIVISATENSLLVFEQNDITSDDPTGACQKKTYTYEALQKTGWIHPKTLPATETVSVTPTIEQVQSQLKDEIAAVTTCQTQLKTANDMNTSLMAEKADLQKQLTILQSKYDNDEKEIVSLTAEIASFTNDRLDYATKAQQSQAEASQLAEFIDTIAAHLAVTTKGLTDDVITNQILLAISLNAKNLSDTQNQLNRYSSVKNAISQTVKAVPSSVTKNLVQKFMSLFFVQK